MYFIDNLLTKKTKQNKTKQKKKTTEKPCLVRAVGKNFVPYKQNLVKNTPRGAY